MKSLYRTYLAILLILISQSAAADSCLEISEKLSGNWTYEQNAVSVNIEFQSGGNLVLMNNEQKIMSGCDFSEYFYKATFWLKDKKGSFKSDYVNVYLPNPKATQKTDEYVIEIGFKKYTLNQNIQAQSATVSQVDNSRDSGFRWEPVIGMGGQIFPSLIIATATWSDDAKKKIANNKKLMGAELIGDPNGLVNVVIQNAEPEANIKIEVNFGSLANPSVFEGVLKQGNKAYIIRPRIDYDYQALLNVKQPMPLNAKIVLYINGEKVGEKIKTVTVRSINDAPRALIVSDSEYVDYKWMFAAYVNENHPWIDQLLRESINTKLVNGFSGYQSGSQGVYQQVFAIWNMLQRRGVKYSNIATSTGYSSVVPSQYVRFFKDTIETSQANCIDGTALFASILRRIGINSQIVLVPGHAFLRFNLNQSGTQYAYLETTMIGNINLSDSILQLKTQNQYSHDSFKRALYEGGRKANIAASKLRSGNDPSYQLIDIEESRKLGIAPINH